MYPSKNVEEKCDAAMKIVEGGRKGTRFEGLWLRHWAGQTTSKSIPGLLMLMGKVH